MSSTPETASPEVATPNRLLPWLLPIGALVALYPAVSVGAGLLLGAGLALTVGNAWDKLTRKASHWLLLAAIVGLGAGADLRVVAVVGAHGLIQTTFSITATLLLAALLMRLYRIPSRTGQLIGIGTAICGGSAIAAVAPILRPKDEEVSVALATVFVLNGVALFLFPVIGHRVGLSPERFGMWAALAIHDTSSVVGAASVFGKKALEIATTLKLTRALWIIPVAFGLSALRRTDRKSQQSIPKPWFLVGFVLAAALNTWWPAFHVVGSAMTFAAQRAMVLALFFIGAGLSRATLRTVGIRPLLYGATLWVIVAGTTLSLIASGTI